MRIAFLDWLRTKLLTGQTLVRSGRGFAGQYPAAADADGNLSLAKWTRAGNGEVDLTGATTRTLTVRNTTASQVANVDVDGVPIWRAGHATGTYTFAGVPTGARVITWPDASITVASLDGAETVTGVKTFSADPVLAREAAHTLAVAASTTTDTAGGALAIRAGAGAATNANGGAITVDAGAKAGSGTDGVCNVGTVNAESVNLCRTGKNTAVLGSLSVAQATTLTGNVGVGAAPVTSAALAVTSTTQGFMPPRMSEAQRDAIATPGEGLVIYNLTSHKLNVRVAAAWEVITSA